VVLVVVVVVLLALLALLVLLALLDELVVEVEVEFWVMLIVVVPELGAWIASPP
jgi:hypothetical protein